MTVTMVLGMQIIIILIIAILLIIIISEIIVIVMRIMRIIIIIIVIISTPLCYVLRLRRQSTRRLLANFPWGLVSNVQGEEGNE